MTYFVILFARGYRPNRDSGGSLQPTGILAATSFPDGAQLYINSQFRSATNSNVNLTPGTYEVEIKKDTYFPWKKTVEIKPEEVSRTQAVLFPTVPSLRAITTAGADLPTLSPDGTKVVFIQTQTNRTTAVFLLDLTDSPLGILNRDPKLLSSLSTKISGLKWSPDSKQVVLSASNSSYIVDVSAGNPQPTNITTDLPSLLAGWEKIQQTRESLKFAALPKSLQEILASSAAGLVWSPKETKVMYTATASATISDNLVRQLPGSSTQTQQRNLKPGNVYVYDLEEDRNFAIGSVKFEIRKGNFEIIEPHRLSWFPTSAHFIKVDQGAVTITEYDTQNPTVVYSGPMEDGYALPYPSGRQLLILSNLNPTLSKIANLYAVSLR
ncbi:MAG: PEGA domain-containing protein [bacterium]|nr:PEGA domain-containing protein [bacterium]